MISKRVLPTRPILRLSLIPAAFAATLFFASSAHAQVNGFNNGTNFTVNGTAQFTDPSTLAITTDVYGEANSVYYNSPVSATAFNASFVYDLAAYPTGDGLSPADGFTFLLQDDPRGLSAVGNSGGNLGYADIGAITPSVAVAFNVFFYHTIGTALLTDGNNPENYDDVTPVNLLADPVLVQLSYAGGNLTETLTDQTTSATYQTNYAIDIPGTLGSSMAYVGFTGGDSGGTSLQLISNFQYQAVPEPGSLAGLGTSLVGLIGLGWRRRRRKSA